MIEKISHIGIAVKSLEETIPFYRDILGLDFAGIEEIPDQKVRVAMFGIGEIRIELLEATDEDSPISGFLEKRGGGVHHIALKVDDIAEQMEQFKSEGIKLINSVPREGARGSQIAFVHPRSAAGTLIELVEEGKK